MSSEEEEVAEDYRTALEELSPSNNRTEIINLTSIARDYTAHALKIAEVLQQHILKVRPASHTKRTAGILHYASPRTHVTKCILLTPTVGCAQQETPGPVCAGLDRQKRRYPVHIVPRQKHLQDIYGILRRGGS
jgi:pre-mRNA cleavage complex 2 protein Pcf11